MTKYRIQKYESFNRISYEVQKKYSLIPIWFSYENIDGYTTGYYNTEKEAMESIERDRFKNKKSTIIIK